ncbi:MAG: rRNA maturation RNase YbeY [Parcubacteria group bacterium]
MVNLEINNQTKFKIPAKTLTPVLDLARKKLKIKTESASARAGRDKQSVSLAFVSPLQIKKLNKKYRHKDKVTDVLSFGIDSADYPLPPTDYSLGEIIICPAQAKKQAKEFKNTFKKEIQKLILHGYLHLLGFDHEIDKDAEVMEGIEKDILLNM